MKRIVAIVKPFKLDSVVEAIGPLALSPIAVSEVRGYGRQKGHLELYGGAEYRITFLPKARLDFCVADEDLDGVIGAIRERAATGRIGDGKIFVQDVRAEEPGHETQVLSD